MKGRVFREFTVDSHVSREEIQGKGEQVNKGGRQEEEEL